MSLDETVYAKRADQELNHLLKQLDEFDPDEVEGYLSQGVLKVTFHERDICVINSHQAAREIWMAHDAQAWHFGWNEGPGEWRCSRSGDELYDRFSKIVSARLEREITLSPLVR